MTGIRRRSDVLAALPWVVAVAATAAALFACVGAWTAEPRFDPVDMNIPAAGVMLIALTAITFAAVGARVSASVPDNPIGWLLLGIGCCIVATLAGIEAVALRLPFEQWGMWLTEWSSICPFFLMVYILLLFPDGRLESPRRRPALWLAHATAAVVMVQVVVPYTERGGAFTNPIGLRQLDGTVLVGNKLGFFMLPVAFVAACASAVVRFRRADDVQRQQLKWFALAGGTVVGVLLVQNLTWVLSNRLDSMVVGGALLVLVASFALVPVASGIAVLRYRLYDIDRVVSRTLSYVGLTGVVVGVYVAMIALTTALLPTHSQAGVAVSTLTAAAAIAPLRRRVQRLVDLRFNRARVDATVLIDRFASQVRTAMGSDTVGARLADAASQALQPAHLSIWTPGSKRG